jgi:predicted  nucleic acid-binding Zn-ribbon protein
MVEDRKMEIETIKKSQVEASLEMKNLRRRSRATDASITNRIQEIEERISGIDDTIEDINTLVKENIK